MLFQKSFDRVRIVISVTQNSQRQTKTRTRKWVLSRSWNFGRERQRTKCELRAISCVLSFH